MPPEIQIGKVVDLKKGSYVWYDNEVWEVEEIEFAKTGKHGSAKARIVIRSLSSGKSTELVKPTQDNIEIPIIKKIRGQVISKNPDGTFTIMNLETYETFEAKAPEHLKNNIQEGQKVLVWDIGEKVIQQAFRD